MIKLLIPAAELLLLMTRELKLDQVYRVQTALARKSAGERRQPWQLGTLDTKPDTNQKTYSDAFLELPFNVKTLPGKEKLSVVELSGKQQQQC